MLVITRTRNFVVLLFVILLLGVGVAVGCSNTNTGPDVDVYGKPTRGNGTTYSSAFEYIVLEYKARYDNSHYENVLSNNSHLFIKNGEIAYDLAIEFVIKNIQMFSNATLYATIVEEAKIYFGLPNDALLPIAFTQKSIQAYFDYEGMHNGINLFDYTVSDMVDDYTTFFTPILKPFEMAILQNYLGMVETNASLSDIEAYLRDSIAIGGISNEFEGFLNVIANNYEFLDTYYPDSPSGGGGVALLQICPKCNVAIGFGTQGIHGSHFYDAAMGIASVDTSYDIWVLEILAILDYIDQLI